jgi:hypothetical protein
MEIINILNELKSTNSTKEKQNILKNNIGNETLFKVLKYAYDNITYTYGITSETMLKFPTEDKSSLSLER